MLRIEADIFSGRPNPAWIVTDEGLTKQVVSAVTENRAIATKLESGFQGLGFRGLNIRVLGNSDDEQAVKALGAFKLATGRGELAEKLIKEMTKSAQIKLPEHEETPINKKIQDLLLSELAHAIATPQKAVPLQKPAPNSRRRTTSDTTCDRCQYEISVFNPAFWNSDPNVQSRNNCYNYARDWRTDTFAQPGRASGHPNGTMQCAQVSAAARFDGLVDRCKCLAASEYPRRLMALVIWPNVDYHWYRQQIGFWGHKPGGTQARNTDNSGALILNPETCNRGGYTNFCGYFYAGKSVKII